MKNYDKNKKPLYIQCLDANNLHGWAMSQKLHINGFEWVKEILSLKFIKLIKNYDKDSDKGCMLEVDVEYHKYSHDLHNDLPFLPEQMKINKCNKLVCNLNDEKIMLFT